MWKHRNYKGAKFLGSYDYNKVTGRRFFELIGETVDGRKVRRVYSAPVNAKNDGWKYKALK